MEWRARVIAKALPSAGVAVISVFFGTSGSGGTCVTECSSILLVRWVCSTFRQQMLVGTISLTRRFDQEPSAFFRVIDQRFEKAGARDVRIIGADKMRLSQIRREALIIAMQVAQHFNRRHVILIAIPQSR